MLCSKMKRESWAQNARFAEQFSLFPYESSFFLDIFSLQNLIYVFLKSFHHNPSSAEQEEHLLVILMNRFWDRK